MGALARRPAPRVRRRDRGDLDVRDVEFVGSITARRTSVVRSACSACDVHVRAGRRRPDRARSRARRPGEFPRPCGRRRLPGAGPTAQRRPDVRRDRAVHGRASFEGRRNGSSRIAFMFSPLWQFNVTVSNTTDEDAVLDPAGAGPVRRARRGSDRVDGTLTNSLTIVPAGTTIDGLMVFDEQASAEGRCSPRLRRRAGPAGLRVPARRPRHRGSSSASHRRGLGGGRSQRALPASHSSTPALASRSASRCVRGGRARRRCARTRTTDRTSLWSRWRVGFFTLKRPASCSIRRRLSERRTISSPRESPRARGRGAPRCTRRHCSSRRRCPRRSRRAPGRPRWRSTPTPAGPGSPARRRRSAGSGEDHDPPAVFTPLHAVGALEPVELDRRELLVTGLADAVDDRRGADAVLLRRRSS